MTWTALDRRRRSDGSSPLVTSLAPQGRTELSAITVENAAAKIANALRAEFELETGQRVGLFLPLHWQRATWLAGTWTAGCVACPDREDVDLVIGTADLVPARSGAPAGIVSTHPFGLPTGEPLPPGFLDASLTAQQQPDAYLFDTPPDAIVLEVGGRTLTASQAIARSIDLAADWGLQVGGRLLVGPDLDELTSWLGILPVPLSVGASVVIVARDQAADRSTLEQEHITATAR